MFIQQQTILVCLASDKRRNCIHTWSSFRITGCIVEWSSGSAGRSAAAGPAASHCQSGDTRSTAPVCPLRVLGTNCLLLFPLGARRTWCFQTDDCDLSKNINFCTKIAQTCSAWSHIVIFVTFSTRAFDCLAQGFPMFLILAVCTCF